MAQSKASVDQRNMCKITGEVVEKIQPGSSVKLLISFPDVDHPIYGKATGLNGEIYLALPHG